MSHSQENNRMSQEISSFAQSVNDHHNEEYKKVLERLQEVFDRNLSENDYKLFRTAGPKNEVNEAYLASFEPEHQQYHDCSCCRHFLQKFGSSVVINKDGVAVAAMWGTKNDFSQEEFPFYHNAINAMRSATLARSVISTLLETDNGWGTYATYRDDVYHQNDEDIVFRHFNVIAPSKVLWNSAVKTPYQRSKAQYQNYINVRRALGIYSMETLTKAINLQAADPAYRSNVIEAPLNWFYSLKQQLEGKGRRVKDNLIWRAVASAPDGFCHIKASMLGTFLDDIAAGRKADVIKRRFESKMDPLQYQRPQASPTKGNIQQGENIIRSLGLENSLLRRYATVDDVLEWSWQPKAPDRMQEAGRVFSHLLDNTKKADPNVSSGQVSTMTWQKFKRQILPMAEKLWWIAPYRTTTVVFMSTAVDSTAEPILRWDSMDQRNPVAWFTYNRAMYANDVGLSAGRVCEVVGITPKPDTWFGKARLGESGDILIVQGCQDKLLDAGLALFPEFMRSELHAVRSTIEAHSNSKKMERFSGEKQWASGPMLHEHLKGADIRLRVLTNGSTFDYHIDRWD